MGRAQQPPGGEAERQLAEAVAAKEAAVREAEMAQREAEAARGRLAALEKTLAGRHKACAPCPEPFPPPPSYRSPYRTPYRSLSLPPLPIVPPTARPTVASASPPFLSFPLPHSLP